MKLWQKDKSALQEVEKFTIGKDRELDVHLAPFDVLGSIAHTRMLESIGLLTKEELQSLQDELKNIYSCIQDRYMLLIYFFLCVFKTITSYFVRINNMAACI